jgi:hypothetical protein
MSCDAIPIRPGRVQEWYSLWLQTLNALHCIYQGHMERGGHGLPKVSLRSGMPYPSRPCRRATPEVAPLQGWPAHWFGGLWLSSTPLDTPHHTPTEYVH